MMQAKAKATKEQKERAERNKNNRPGDWGGRGDTWTDTSQPLYDRYGNQVGTYNTPNYDDGRR